MGDIVLTGIPADYALPGNYIETNLGVGPSSGNDTSYPMVLIGNKLATGSATPNTALYGPTSTPPLQTEGDAIALFGSGSELHRAFLRVTDPRMGAANQTTALYAIAVAESVGLAASLVVTFAGTATLPGGSVRVYVGDEFVEAPVFGGDTPTVIAAACVVAVNAKSKWGVVASSALGVLTLTCKNKGPRGNFYRGQVVISGGITTTATGALVPTYFTGGTVVDDNTLALATLSSKRFYFHVSAANDAAQFGSLSAQVAAMQLPAIGIRQRCFAASVDTLANVITITNGINAARAEYIHAPNFDWPPFEIAAFTAAIYASSEPKPKPRHNFSGFGNGNSAAESVWKVPAPRDGTAPSSIALNTAIKNGITPIGVNPNGTTYIVKRCTTRCLNGSIQDFRSRDAHKVTVTDYFADDWYAKLNAQFSGKDITDDPAQGAHVPGANVATPTTIRTALYGLIDQYNDNDQVQKVSDIKSGSQVQRAVTPRTRVGIRIPLFVIDILDQTTTSLDQVGGLLLFVGAALLAGSQYFV